MVYSKTADQQYRTVEACCCYFYGTKTHCSIYSHSSIFLVGVFAGSVPESFLPLSVVDISVRISVDALAVLQVIIVITFVLGTGQLKIEAFLLEQRNN